MSAKESEAGSESSDPVVCRVDSGWARTNQQDAIGQQQMDALMVPLFSESPPRATVAEPVVPVAFFGLNEVP